jgi:hypothetical protein
MAHTPYQHSFFSFHILYGKRVPLSGLAMT